jgi:hypothetical protein
MVPHLCCLAIIHAVRGLAGLGFAVVFLYYSNADNIPSDPIDLTMSRFHNLEPGDPVAFLVVGCVLVVLQLVRLSFSFATIRALVESREASPGGRRAYRFVRRFGLAIAVVDLVDLTLFPLTTACGLYGWLVFRHSDTRDLLEGKFASV